MRATLALLLALPQGGFQESIEVRIHNVDVVVTNAKGEAVTGLRKEDFELREDGAPQTITNFSAYEALPVDTPLVAPDEPATVAQAPAPAPPRTFLFYIDDMSLDEPTLKSLSENLSEFVVKNLREGDTASVVQPANVTNLALDLTTDRDALRQEIIDAVATNKLNAKPVGFESDVYLFEREIKRMVGNQLVPLTQPTAESKSIANRYADKATRRVMQRLGTLRALIAALGPIPGRKVLIAVTQNFSARPGAEFWERYQQILRQQAMDGQGGIPLSAAAQASKDLLQSKISKGEAFAPSLLDNSERITGMTDLTKDIKMVARLASSNGVTLYAVRPENDLGSRMLGPDVVDPNLGDGGMPTGMPDIGMGTMLQHAISNTDQAIIPMVDITGGRQFLPSDDLGDAMNRIAGDVNNYYSLAYRGSGGLDKPHKIEVRVRNRPELKVRARNEVERKSPRKELTDLVSAALVAPDSAGNVLGIDAAEVETGKKLVLEVHIPMSSLDFEKSGNFYRARYTAHYAVSGGVTDYVSGMHEEHLVEVPAADWASAQTKHWTHVVTINRRTKAHYRVAVGIMDARTQAYGITTLDVAESGSD
ncbi:MAG TPA: VWA domain-containing protein [Thermoanaerobaculia bacterium]